MPAAAAKSYCSNTVQQAACSRQRPYAHLRDRAQQAGVESVARKQHQGIAAKAAQPSHLPVSWGQHRSESKLISSHRPAWLLKVKQRGEAASRASAAVPALTPDRASTHHACRAAHRVGLSRPDVIHIVEVQDSNGAAAIWGGSTHFPPVRWRWWLAAVHKWCKGQMAARVSMRSVSCFERGAHCTTAYQLQAAGLSRFARLQASH